MSDHDARGSQLTEIEPSTAPAGASERRRMGVWENEGGLLADPGEAPVGLDAHGAGSRWTPTVLWSELLEDRPVHVEPHGVPVLLVRSAGQAHALLDECSHGHVRLSEGDVADGVVECWLHGSCFDLTTGVPGGPPAITPVPVFEVRVADGVVEVALSAPPATG